MIGLAIRTQLAAANGLLFRAGQVNRHDVSLANAMAAHMRIEAAMALGSPRIHSGTSRLPAAPFAEVCRILIELEAAIDAAADGTITAVDFAELLPRFSDQIGALCAVQYAAPAEPLEASVQ